MRLSEKEKQAILKVVRQSDPRRSTVVWFRTDDHKKGGDIDLLVLSKRLEYRDKLKIRYRLKDELGNRKIDLIITPRPDNAFERHAMNTSLVLS